MRGCLTRQHVRVRPGHFGSEYRDHGGLAGRRVLAGCLAGFFRGAFDVQQIVGDLERRAKVPAIGGDLMPLTMRCPAEDRAGLIRDVPRLALNAQVAGRSVRDLARQMVAIAPRSMPQSYSALPAAM